MCDTQPPTASTIPIPNMPSSDPPQPYPKARRSSETALMQHSRLPPRRNSLATTAIFENTPRSTDFLDLRSLPKYNLYIPEHKVRSSAVALNLARPIKDEMASDVIIPRRSLRHLVNRSREFSPAKYHVHDVVQSVMNLSGINNSNNSLHEEGSQSQGAVNNWSPPTSLLADNTPANRDLGKVADEDEDENDNKYYLVDVGKIVDIDSTPPIPDISVSQADVSQGNPQDSGYSLEAQPVPESVPLEDGIVKEKNQTSSDSGNLSEVAETQKMGQDVHPEKFNYPSEEIKVRETRAHSKDAGESGLIPVQEVPVSREGTGEDETPIDQLSLQHRDETNESYETDRSITKKNKSSEGSLEDHRVSEDGHEDSHRSSALSPPHSPSKIQHLVYKLFHPGPRRASSEEEDDELDESKAEGDSSHPLKKKSSLVYKIFHPGTRESDDDREDGRHRSGADDTGHETDVDEREHRFELKPRKKKKRSFVDKILHPLHPHDEGGGEGKEHRSRSDSAHGSEKASIDLASSEQSKKNSSSSLENASSDLDNHGKKSKSRPSSGVKRRALFGRFSPRSGSSDGEAALEKGKGERGLGSSDEEGTSDAYRKGGGVSPESRLHQRQSNEQSERRRRPPPLPKTSGSERASSSENMLSPSEAAPHGPRHRQKKKLNAKTRRTKQTSSEDTESAEDSTRHKDRHLIAARHESPDGHLRPFFHKFLLNQSYLRPSSTPASPSGRLTSGEDPSPHLEDHQIPEFEALPEPLHPYDHAKEIFKELIHVTPHRRRSHTFSGHVHPGTSLSPKPALHDEHDLYEKYGVCDEVIGKGASATVRLAHKKTKVPEISTPNEKLFAVKRFRKRRKDEKEKEYIKKLTSEFCISSNLHHINVVETVDLIEDENLGWCEVMEYLPGGSLFDKIATGGELDVFEINCYFRQLINGVTYLHSVGVAHRDLKPENLLLAADGCILKIADFGVSEVFRIVWETKSRKLKGLAGSEPYIAPEEFTNQEYDPTKVDVWACGIIYYAMVHHSVPFLTASENDDQYKNFLKNRLGSYPPIDNLADGPKNMLNSILDPNPDMRISMESIRDDSWFSAIDFCTAERKGRYHTHSPCKHGGDKGH